jgi:hypothetical protein
MGYGAWKCSSSCRPAPASNGLVVLPPKVGEPFTEAVLALGTDFTGFALTDPYTTPEGAVEQIFENMVLAADPSSPGKVSLRAITERIGIAPEPLIASEYSSDMVFYPVQAGRGHHVPIGLLEFLAGHGGMETSGAPITAFSQISEEIFRQCFTNLCLEEHHNPSGAVWIRPAPLGYTYRARSIQGSVGQSDQASATPAVPSSSGRGEAASDQTPGAQPGAESFTDSLSLKDVSIQVWEKFPMVTPKEGQEIGAALFENSQPMASIEPDLLLNLPDGQRKTYYMLPTGSDGQTHIKVDPVAGPNGTLIPYEVCVSNMSGEKTCVKDSYLIWENP